MDGRSRWRGCVQIVAVGDLTVHCRVGILLGERKKKKN